MSRLEAVQPDVCRGRVWLVARRSRHTRANMDVRWCRQTANEFLATSIVTAVYRSQFTRMSRRQRRLPAVLTATRLHNPQPVAVGPMGEFLKQYEPKNLNASRQWLLLGTAIVLVHSGGGIAFWSYFIFFELVRESRHSSLDQFWSYLGTMLPFYSRGWKSVGPFVASLITLYLIPRHTKASLILLACTLLFTVLFAWYDIAHHDGEIATFGVDPRFIYFNWWWY